MIEVLQQIFYPEIKRHLKRARRVFYIYPLLPFMALLLGVVVGLKVMQSIDLDDEQISLLKSEIQEQHIRNENLEKNKENSIQILELIIQYQDKKIADYERSQPESSPKIKSTKPNDKGAFIHDSKSNAFLYFLGQQTPEKQKNMNTSLNIMSFLMTA